MRLTPITALAALFAFACGGDDTEAPLDQRAVLPALPANATRFLLPEITFEPGSDRQTCVYMTTENTEPVWISAFQGHQGSAGHHLVAFTTIEDEPDGSVIDCSSAERMLYWRLLFIPFKDGNLALPDGYAFQLPAKQKIVLQLHYVNATLEPMVTRDALDIFTYEGQDQPVAVAPFTVGSADFEIPPMQAYTGEYSCRAEQELNVTRALGHMHEHGTALSIRVEDREIYSASPWRAEYRDTAPLAEWPWDDPLKIATGENIRVRCDWQSTVDEELTFPEEMCAGVLWFYPAQSPITCRGVSDN